MNNFKLSCKVFFKILIAKFEFIYTKMYNKDTFIFFQIHVIV